CGGSCGSCEDGSVCSESGGCLCVPDCDREICGSDDCPGDGACGRCDPGRTCSGDGERCECIPDCAGKTCGDDGCGGACPPGCAGDAATLRCNTREGVCV